MTRAARRSEDSCDVIKSDEHERTGREDDGDECYRGEGRGRPADGLQEQREVDHHVSVN